MRKITEKCNFLEIALAFFIKQSILSVSMLLMLTMFGQHGEDSGHAEKSVCRTKNRIR